jgi:hypothetical protein
MELVPIGIESADDRSDVQADQRAAPTRGWKRVGIEPRNTALETPDPGEKPTQPEALSPRHSIWTLHRTSTTTQRVPDVPLTEAKPKPTLFQPPDVLALGRPKNRAPQGRHWIATSEQDLAACYKALGTLVKSGLVSSASSDGGDRERQRGES